MLLISAANIRMDPGKPSLSVEREPTFGIGYALPIARMVIFREGYRRRTERPSPLIGGQGVICGVDALTQGDIVKARFEKLVE